MFDYKLFKLFFVSLSVSIGRLLWLFFSGFALRTPTKEACAKHPSSALRTPKKEPCSSSAPSAVFFPFLRRDKQAGYKQKPNLEPKREGHRTPHKGAPGWPELNTQRIERPP